MDEAKLNMAKLSLDDHVRSIAIFFFYALLDKDLAVHAAERSVGAWKASGFPTDLSLTPAQVRTRMVRLCKSRFDSEKPRNPRELVANAAQLTEAIGWVFADVSLIPAWVKFSRDNNEDERLALIFCRLLGFPEADVAEGLGISLGTLRHRISRGARQFGSVVRGRQTA